MKTQGFSLVELLVVIGLIVIIAAIAVPQYGLMRQRRSIEKQMREIHSDISDFRLSAIHNKQRRAILIGPNTLQFKRYNNTTEDLFVGGIVISTKNLNHEIQRGFDNGDPLQAFAINADAIEFDERGYSNNLTIVATPVDIAGNNNCLILHFARTNLGRMLDATTCQAR